MTKLTLVENIADWREIADMPKPVKDPRIVSLEQYLKDNPTEPRVIVRNKTKVKYKNLKRGN